MIRRAAFSLLALGLFACGSEALDREALMDPEACKTCHPTQYRQWSGSMHAYAGEDPIFLAWNRKGQAETNGELGDFCVKCHAPIAVREGATTDGLNLDQIDRKLRGVTCYFCHSVEAVDGEHNNPLVLAQDGVLRGGIADPVPTPAHPAVYSPLHDRNRLESSTLCGSCHDIVNGHGFHLERTFYEWKNTLYAKEDPRQRQTCGTCHMSGEQGLAAEAEGVFLRRIHDHSVPGVDLAMIDFPERDAQRELVQLHLDTVLFASLCVFPIPGGTRAVLTLENFAAGHSFPSGATADRRAWVELRAFLGARSVFDSGVVADGQAVAEAQAMDPTLWRFGDRVFDAEDREVHDFWEVVRADSELLPGPVTNDRNAPDYVPTHLRREYEIPDAVTKITVRVRMRAIGLEILEDLEQNGGLDPAIRPALPTFDLRATALEWKAEDGQSCVPFDPNP